MKLSPKALFIFPFLSMFFVSLIQAQNKLPQIGDQAPALHIDSTLSPAGSKVPTLKNLRGKVVLLEFWATWCGACIPAIDHLNKLKHAFSDEQLAIIAISDEESEQVEQFLKNKPVDFTMVLDRNDQSFKIYQPRVIPHTVVINPAGTITAITLPENVTETTIRSLLNGKSIDLPLKPYGNGESTDQKLITQNQQKQDAHTLFKTIIKKSESASGYLKSYGDDSTGLNYHNRRITAAGAWPIALFSYAFDMPNNRIEDRAHLPEQGYDMDIILPKPDSMKLKQKMTDLLVHAFQIKTRMKTESKQGYRLQRISGQKLNIQKSKAAKPLYTMRGPNMKARKQPIQTLVNYLNNFTGNKPVVDKTELKGLYDYFLNWTFSDPKSIYKALHKLGLEMVPDTVAVEVLILSKDSF